ncbi:MAG: UvrD-helicase domain-containing protein [Streptosporangiaceae bacterium]|nr:UvrD-helicase domain-containing protein [Streptosporangiaceae bacterium]
MITGGNQPTDEQRAVVDACVAGENLVIEAGAGTGKTSTLQLTAAAMVDRRGLYLAYNKVTAEEARRSFPPYVTCRTAHSLAYSAAGFRYSHRLPGQAARVPAWAAANMLGIGGPLRLGDDLLLTPGQLARIVMATVERFCHSADPVISGSHVPEVNGVDPVSFAELTWQIVPYAIRAWLDIQRPNGKLPFKHDHYLKMWQLAGPVIHADFVMFDEAQDANPVTAAIIQSQRGTQMIAVGDSCQAIYGWRGAVDALATWPADQRLLLSHSFRFGPAVADEANKWLNTLAAPYRLSGTPLVESTVGTVADPQVVLCRTNAEALVQARGLLDAGRRVALAGGGGDIRSLAVAALDLQAAGRTSNPELAAFQSWHAVQDFVRTDTAGADLAASVRLIDAYGAAGVLGILARLASEGRAEVTVSTAHGAKGREWERVRIADDFREPRHGAVPRADAMLAYVAVTRARRQLDRAGLTWIDDHIGGHSASSPDPTRKEANQMEQEDQTQPGPFEEEQPGAARPYQGGRAQAESGSRIIQNDYDVWVAVGGSGVLPGDHPRVMQFAQAWRTIARHGLDDEPGAAAIRYQVLAHAAAALAEATAPDDRPEVAALTRLAGHARLHVDRLRATAEHHFLRSPKAGPYQGGRAQAASGSRIVEKDYLTWARNPAAAQAANNSKLKEHAQRLERAWDEIRHRGLVDGPAPAAARYRELADASSAMARDYSTTLQSSSLTLLLELANHAGKHAIRLHATADARAEGTDAAPHERQVAAVIERFSKPAQSGAAGQDLPGEVAAVVMHARAGHPEAGHAIRAHASDARGARALNRTQRQAERG